MQENVRYSAAEQELQRLAAEVLVHCAAGLDADVLASQTNEGATVDVFDLAALDDAVRHARLLPADSRDIRLGYLRRAAALGPRRRLAAPLTALAIEGLHRRHPNAAKVLEVVAANAALSRLCPSASANLPPILLLGRGGVGKTALARAITLALGLQPTEVSLGGTSSGFVLAGLDIGYATGKPGRVFEVLALGEYANPVILLDELDKASSDDRYPVTPVLYTLLESLTARTFTDEAIPLPIDASHVQWIATANYESLIEPALLSRFEVFEIPVPTPEQTIQIARCIYAETVAQEPWGSQFPPTPEDVVLERISELPPRETRKCLFAAFGNAALAGRRHLVPDDITVRSDRNRPGFA